MSKKFRSLEEKIEIITKFQQGQSLRSLSKEYGVMHKTVIEWTRRYKLYGKERLGTRKSSYNYSPKQKEEMINQVLKNHIPLPQVAAYYDVSEAALSRWIKTYNSMPEIEKMPISPLNSAQEGNGCDTSVNPNAVDKILKENISLKVELALLKKAYALVAERINPNRKNG